MGVKWLDEARPDKSLLQTQVRFLPRPLKLNYEIKRNIFNNSGILFIAYSNVFIKVKLNYD